MKEINNAIKSKGASRVPNIDESLYSRQLLTLGRDAMNKMTGASVLISCSDNISGLAVEVAKCVILAGVGRVSLHSMIDTLTYKDLASNYYASPEDVGGPMAQKIITSLGSLNSNVQIDFQPYLTTRTVKSYDCVVFCDYIVHKLLFWNRFCRENNIKFIFLQTCGLMGSIFCDFGKTCTIPDIDGEPAKSGLITKIENNRFFASEPHKLYTGDVISLNLNLTNNYDDSVQFLIRVFSATEFELREYKDVYKQYSQEQLQIQGFNSPVIVVADQIPQNVMFKQIKLPVTLHFKSLEKSLIEPDFVHVDTAIWDMPKILHTFMKAMSMWKIDNRCTFDESTYVDDVWETFPISQDDYASLKRYFIQEIVFSKAQDKLYLNQEVEQIFDRLAMTCAGRVCGVDAVIGAMGAQEVIKAVSNKFTPTKQFLYFEALNILPDDYVENRKQIESKNPLIFKPRRDRYDAQTIIFGRQYIDAMHKKKVFIVGAGAIGCEHIKNFSMMGVNNIVVTDMDRIENSNLNRQFLFRREDIGHPKSVIASKKAMLINPDTTVTAHENKVGKETVGVYNWEFFNSLDVVTNALDNVDARLFVDALCVKYNKPLLESGTLGTKGSIQCVIPDLTESYGSIQDPPEQSIPVCTLKLFPYKFEHVVQYARDLFEGYFNRIPGNYIKTRDSPESLNQMTPSDLQILHDDLTTLCHGCKNFKYCINLAYKQWHVLFRDVIRQLIKKYPKDHKDDEDMLFWSGTKMFPQAFDFNTENQHHMDFVIYFSHVWADMLGIPDAKRYGADRKDRFKKFLDRLSPPKEVSCKDIVQKEKKSVKDIEDPNQHSLISRIKTLMQENAQYLQNVKQIEFEKDDDENHHIDFVTAFANLRASNYTIETKDRMATKGIAGKIIPAIATTTSVVSGLVSLEMYKVFYNNMLKLTKDCLPYATLQRFRYGSFNLAVQSFGFSESNPAKYIVVNGNHNSIWTKHDIDPDMKLSDLIELWSELDVERFVDGEKKSMIMSVDFISGDSGIIYSNMMDENDDSVHSNVKLKTFRQIINQSSEQKSQKTMNQEGDYYFTLSLEETDMESEDLDNVNVDTMLSLRVKIRNQDSRTVKPLH